MLAIVLPTIVTIFAFAFWFRASNARAHRWPDWEYSGRIELVVWSVPALTVILLGGVAWIGSHLLDPAKPIEGASKPLTIQAVSLDWKWLFIYPDQKVATVNTLTVPVGAPLQFQLTSASVMNAFFIPQFGSMICTMNGMATRLNLRANDPGTFQGLSTQFSGDGFSDMHFRRPSRHGRSIAVHRSFVAYVAAVVQVAISDDGHVSVPRVDMAVDCGLAVNPDRVRAQMEGAAMMGLSSAVFVK
jgi:cytochrome o ubiquinol oxidase subunit II